jgi:hypothetical protein
VGNRLVCFGSISSLTAFVGKTRETDLRHYGTRGRQERFRARNRCVDETCGFAHPRRRRGLMHSIRGGCFSCDADDKVALDIVGRSRPKRAFTRTLLHGFSRSTPEQAVEKDGRHLVPVAVGHLNIVRSNVPRLDRFDQRLPRRLLGRDMSRGDVSKLFLRRRGPAKTCRQ